MIYNNVHNSLIPVEKQLTKTGKTERKDAPVSVGAMRASRLVTCIEYCLRVRQCQALFLGFCDI